MDTEYVEPNVRPQDDLYRHLNGKWLDTFVIPADKSNYGSFTFIDDQAQQQMRGIVENLTDSAGKVTATGDAAVDARKLADLYASFMDEPRLETLGVSAHQSAVGRHRCAGIQARHSRAHRALQSHRRRRAVRHGHRCGRQGLHALRGDVCGRAGLGLPDRDYYLKDDAKLKDARVNYLAHIEKMLAHGRRRARARRAPPTS